MTQLIDFSFKTDLKLKDILIAADGNRYIIAQSGSDKFPFTIVDMITYQPKRNLTTLKKQVTRSGHVLGIGYLHKIIDADDYELELHIVPKQPFA